MSELTPCNFCNLQRIENKAKKLEKRVQLVESPELPYFPNSVSVHIVDSFEKPSSKNFEAWFGELGQYCEC